MEDRLILKEEIYIEENTQDEPQSSGDSGDESGSEPESPSDKLQPVKHDWGIDDNETIVIREPAIASTSSTTHEADSSKSTNQPSQGKSMPKLELPGGAVLYHPSVLGVGLDGLGPNLGLGNLAMGYPPGFLLGLANQGQDGASSSNQPQFITIPLSMAMAASSQPNGGLVSASSDDSSELQDLSTGGRK